MSEQLVIIVLITLTLIIVLVALAIPDVSSPAPISLDMYSAVSMSPETVVSDTAIDQELRSLDVNVDDAQGAEPEDARRAADILDEPGR